MTSSHRSTPGTIRGYVLSVAIGSTAYIAQFAAATVAAREITGSSELAGLPSAIGTLATAIATALLTGVMRERGRRLGLVIGYSVAVLGALAGVVAVAVHSFPLLVLGSAGVGFGNASLNLTRYAAADLVEPADRARVLAVVVWASTVGAVLGPNLVDPAGRIGAALGMEPLAAGIAFSSVAFALSTMLATRGPRGRGGVVLPAGVEPAAGPDAPGPSPAMAAVPRVTARRAADVRFPRGRLAPFAPIRVRIALAGLLTGQVVMNLLMTMAPVRVHDMGEPMSSVGFVISAHTLGMFALAPVTARLVERFGQVRVVLAGFTALFASAVLAGVAGVAHETQLPLLALGLFLLGYGWNLCFVAGSALLTFGSSYAERVRLQGLADALVWTSSAVAAGASGPILDAIGFEGLAVVAILLLAPPAVAVLILRRRLSVPARHGPILAADA